MCENDIIVCLRDYVINFNQGGSMVFNDSFVICCCDQNSMAEYGKQ